MMMLDFERLDVYQAALDFLVLANDVVEQLPRGRGVFADQLSRASSSIVLNIAEGSGKHSRADKRRYYLSARGSATECAGLFEALARLKIVESTTHLAAKQLLVRIVSMLVKLAQALERPAPE